jgi:peptide/nickel transport system substrate-binding protein
MAMAAAPARAGGTLVVGRVADAITLDPNDAPDTESVLAACLVGETLVRFKPGTLTMEPWLAQSWEALDGGKRWRFKLRPGIAFSDGTPFNAEAVEFSFMRILDKQHPYNKYAKFNLALASLGSVESVRAVDNMTVDFRLKAAFAPFLTALTGLTAAIISPSAVKKDPVNFFKAPVGTGPFRIVEWTKDDRIVLDRNDRYWNQGTTHGPFLNRIVFRVIPENASRVLALRKGEIDAMTAVDLAGMKVLAADPNVVVQRAPGLAHVYLAMNLLKKPFEDVRVRAAFHHAINRKVLVDNFWAAATLAKGVMSPLSLGFNEDLKWPEYNPEKARGLLKQAGQSSLKTTVHTFSQSRPYLPEPRKTAEAIQADLAKVGVQMEIVLVEANALFGELRAARHDMYLGGFIPIVPDPWNVMFTQFDTRRSEIGAANNFSFYRNAVYDRLNDRATTAASLEERSRIYRQMQEILHRDVARIDIADVDLVFAYRKSVKNMTPSAATSTFWLQYAWLEE